MADFDDSDPFGSSRGKIDTIYSVTDDFHHALNRQRFVLAELFHNSMKAHDLLTAAEPKLARLIKALPAFRPDEVPEEFEDDDRFEVEELQTFAIFQDDIREIFAGTLVLIVDRMIRRLRKRLNLHQDSHVAIMCGKVTLTEALQAAGNNFRHFEEWSDEKSLGDPRRDRNLRLLRDAGVKEPARGTACFEVLNSLRCRTYLDFEEQLHLVAKQLLERASNLTA
jgi:hypothetical protein